jgi:hypothetical protein
LAFACLLFVAQAQAAVDCDKAELAQNERLDAYLKAYATECTADKLDELLKKYGITVPERGAPVGEENLFRMIPAWHDIKTRFGTLAAQADRTSQMKAVYSGLSNRAETAGTQLETALANKSIPDVTAFAHDAWKIGANLVLFDYQDLPVLEVDRALNADCSNRASDLCRRTLGQGRELMVQWRLADRISFAASQVNIQAIAKQVEAKEALWNKYLYDSKPMLPFDFVLTDWLTGGWSKSDQYPEGFREPPATQWFLFHPALGVEYASAAADGEQLKPMLYIELIGANRWRDDKRWVDAPGLRYFSGFSLIASYADRAGIKDVGYGGLFTFDNVFSLGVVRYGTDTGIFLSVDLANAWREKYKPRYEKYKNMLDEYKKLR